MTLCKMKNGAQCHCQPDEGVECVYDRTAMHAPVSARPILYTDTISGVECHRDDMWAVTTAELNALAQPRAMSDVSDAEILAIANKIMPHRTADANYKYGKNLIAFARALLAAQGDAPNDLPVQSIDGPLMWESTTPAYIHHVTDSRFKKFSPAVQKWYRPICQQCASTKEQT